MTAAQEDADGRPRNQHHEAKRKEVKTVLLNKSILKAEKDKLELAAQYGVSVSAVVWMGDNKYAIVKDGMTIII